MTVSSANNNAIYNSINIMITSCEHIYMLHVQCYIYMLHLQPAHAAEHFDEKNGTQIGLNATLFAVKYRHFTATV